jgi:hypothetical protein
MLKIAKNFLPENINLNDEEDNCYFDAFVDFITKIQ